MERHALTAELIVTETLALIDEQGIGGASMRTVAQRLGVRAMSLYRHVGGREELLDAVVERVVDELSKDPEVPQTHVGIGWRDYLHGLAYGVRRCARAHPHAFPLVATRPPGAPWVNPPLRSLRWIESMLSNLADAGFDDDGVLFTYRTFNSFLLGYLLLETSAMVIDDPKPGDGSFQPRPEDAESSGHDPVDPADPVPGSISPTRTAGQRRAITNADDAGDLVAGYGDVDAANFPLIYRLRNGLTENRFAEEFAAGLDILLARIAAQVESSDAH